MEFNITIVVRIEYCRHVELEQKEVARTDAWQSLHLLYSYDLGLDWLGYVKYENYAETKSGSGSQINLYCYLTK